MRFILSAAVLLGLVAANADTCSHDAEVKCIDDINKAYALCDKAAKQKAKDLPADLECMKYLTTMQKDCWGCICVIAKAQKWHVKGCDSKLLRQ